MLYITNNYKFYTLSAGLCETGFVKLALADLEGYIEEEKPKSRKRPWSMLDNPSADWSRPEAAFRIVSSWNDFKNTSALRAFFVMLGVELDIDEQVEKCLAEVGLTMNKGTLEGDLPDGLSVGPGDCKRLLCVRLNSLP
jgi:hypothetical protein